MWLVDFVSALLPSPYMASFQAILGQCISVMYLRLKQLGDQVTWNTSATHNIEALGLGNG